MENSCHGYHGFTVHQTYFEMMMNLGTTPPGIDWAAHAYQRTFLIQHGFPGRIVPPEVSSKGTSDFGGKPSA